MTYKTSLYPGVPSYVLQEGLGTGARVTQWLPRGHFDLPGSVNLGDVVVRPLVMAKRKSPSRFQSRVMAVAARTKTRNPRYAAAIAAGSSTVRRAHAAAAESSAKNIYNIAISMPAESRKEFLQEALNSVAPGLYGAVASRASTIEARGNNANDATIAAMSDALAEFANEGKIQDDSMAEFGMEQEEWMDPQNLDDVGDVFKKIGSGIKKAAVATGKGVKAAAKAVGKATRSALCTAGKLTSDSAVGSATANVVCKAEALAPSAAEQMAYQEASAGGMSPGGGSNRSAERDGGGSAGGMSTSTKLLIGGAAVGGVLLLIMATRKGK